MSAAFAVVFAKIDCFYLRVATACERVCTRIERGRLVLLALLLSLTLSLLLRLVLLPFLLCLWCLSPMRLLALKLPVLLLVLPYFIPGPKLCSPVHQRQQLLPLPQQWAQHQLQDLR
jgi:hypothetical protein